MKYVVGSSIGVKASGGIRSKEDAQAMIASGADKNWRKCKCKDCLWRKPIVIIKEL